MMQARNSDERLVTCVTTHWMKYMTNGLRNHFLVGIGILLLYVSSIALFKPVAIITCSIGIVLILYAHHHFFHKLMSESMIDIFVTSERIIYFDDSLYLANNEHEIPLHRVAGIEASQSGLLQNILNYGTLWIDTGGGSVDLQQCVPYVPRPEEMSEKIAHLVHNENED